MHSFKHTLKTALENCVLCRGAHSASESYEYAEKMHTVVVSKLKDELKAILESDEPQAELRKIIKELE